MWNDEDNNPYGTSFDHGHPAVSPGFNESDADWESADAGFDAVSTPPSSSPTRGGSPLGRQPFSANAGTASDDDEPEEVVPPRRKPGGYDSRIEQILYEQPDRPILITDAGKSLEGTGRFIVYTIRTGQDLEVKRRYSEFHSLRDALTRLHPTLVVPPIPEKQSMADYAANPTKAKQDQHMIELRKRMLAVFLNRCRNMEQIRTDGVWWRFLDPNASWSEVLNSPPVSTIPKLILKAPPLDAANPTPGHAYLPVPASNAKLKAVAGTSQHLNSGAINSGARAFNRFPPDGHGLGEQELDPYFVSYEASIRDLDALLTGPMEKVNRRTVSHLSSLGADLCELGARFNALALSETAPSLGQGIEKVGQAADSSYLLTEELSASLGAGFAEPMRENAQFAGVVRNVLRYRVLKRVQQEMTNDELNKKTAHLDQLERSEAESRRIELYLSNSQQLPAPSGRRRRSSGSRDNIPPPSHDGGNGEDTASIDSDFPPTHGEFPSAQTGHSAEAPKATGAYSSLHRKMSSGNSLTNKIFGPIRHAVQGVVDVDPEKSRRDLIGKTRESIEQLGQAKVVSEQDVREASASILKDLKRFQGEKEDDLRRYMLAFAKCQLEWARKCRDTWEEARTELDRIEET